MRFRNTLIDAAKKTAEASGAEIVVYDAENSIENQVAQIKQAVAEDYDAIMCGPVDADTAPQSASLPNVSAFPHPALPALPPAPHSAG